MPTGASSNGDTQVENGNSTNITADEIALYDRQIRLWGMKAQEKIRGANVLLIQMRALGNEVAKNLVLAGIGKLTIIDHAVASEVDFAAQFLLPSIPETIGQNRAEACFANLQKLNPRVSITYDTSDIKSKDPSFFDPFNMVISTDLWDPQSVSVIDAATRTKGIPFYAAGVHGLYGYIFADLVEHEFVVEREASNRATVSNSKETRTCTVVDVQRKKNDAGKNVEMVTFRELYSTFVDSNISKLAADIYTRRNRLRAVSHALPCFRALFKFAELNSGKVPKTRQDIETFTRLATAEKSALGLPEELKSDFLRGFLQGVGTEIVAVSAIIGGQLAQDVINVLGGTQQPIQNMLVFDGNNMEANVYSLHPEGELGRGIHRLVDNGDDCTVVSVVTNGKTAPVIVPVVEDGPEPRNTVVVL